MQFKHPEILWALLLLLIPIIIHLLQLRRFKKTPFTNVAMLQRVVSESRKSQNLKKWLLLFTRLFLLAALVIAFAQPFTSKTNALTKRETVIYLDNSFSMQAKQNGITLFNKLVQEFIQQMPETSHFSLFTNSHTYSDVTIKEIQNELLSTPLTPTQLGLDQILLKANSLFSSSDGSIKNLIIISDLQERVPPNQNLSSNQNVYVVQSVPKKIDNSYIDSLYLGVPDGNQIPLMVRVIGLEEGKNIPISLYNEDKLIAKTAVKGNSTKISTTQLSLENKRAIKGRLVINDNVLRYDDQYFFNINQRNPPKVLAISEERDTFLKRIYAGNEFDFKSFNLNNLNYSLIEKQNTVILNGLSTIPNSLSSVLRNFYLNNGTLVIIPSQNAVDFNSYNAFLQQIATLKLKNFNKQEQRISKIAFQHPLYQNVFKKTVTNFEYPKVSSFYTIDTQGATALSFGDNTPFLYSVKNLHIFTASLSSENSNFINSPLIVPTFYNIGENSLKNPLLYQTIGKSQDVDINLGLAQDKILKLSKGKDEFIPLQQSLSNKVRLSFGDNPTVEGIYAVLNGKDTIQYLSFNYPRNESNLNYLDASSISGANAFSELSDLFEKFSEDTSITDYWKWFVIFALLFAVLELLTQKFLK